MLGIILLKWVREWGEYLTISQRQNHKKVLKNCTALLAKLVNTYKLKLNRGRFGISFYQRNLDAQKQSRYIKHIM